MTNPAGMPSITADQIDRAVAQFYARVRDHTELAPLFNEVIPADGWTAHEETVARFWRGMLLGEESYSGNPLKAHMRAGNITPAHFAPWLELFDRVLAEELAPEQARAWSAAAHRIGQRLRMGMQGHVPPHLQG